LPATRDRRRGVVPSGQRRADARRSSHGGRSRPSLPVRLVRHLLWLGLVARPLGFGSPSSTTTCTPRRQCGRALSAQRSLPGAMMRVQPGDPQSRPVPRAATPGLLSRRHRPGDPGQPVRTHPAAESSDDPGADHHRAVRCDPCQAPALPDHGAARDRDRAAVGRAHRTAAVRHRLHHPDHHRAPRLVEVAKKNTPTGERTFVKNYPKDDEQRRVSIDTTTIKLLREHLLAYDVRDDDLLFTSTAATALSGRCPGPARPSGTLTPILSVGGMLSPNLDRKMGAGHTERRQLTTQRPKSRSPPAANQTED
jgi:hypothetical protein